MLDNSEVIVVGNKAAEFREIEKRLRAGQTLIDLVRISEGRTTDETYQGICW